MDVLIGIVWIFWIVVLLVLYHKCFHVVYFSLSDGFLKELFVSGLIGAVLTALTFTFWWVILIVGAIALIVKSKS